MRTSLVSIVGVSAALLFAACGDSDETGAGGSGNAGGDGGDAGAGNSGNTGNTGNAGGEGGEGGDGGGGSPGDGNDSFEEAIPIPADGMGVTYELDPVDGDADYYVFDGLAGVPLIAAIDAKVTSANMDPFDPAYPDYVLELFDANQNRIALNDDPEPRSTQDPRLYTVLPADGQYYIRVSEFCTYSPQDYCDDTYFGGITETEYTLVLGGLNFGSLSLVDEGPEPNDTDLNATVMTYLESTTTPGAYLRTTAHGDFADDTDIDGFLVNLPDNQTTDTRTATQVVMHTPGNMGNGSSAIPGILQLVNVNTGLVYAEANAMLGNDLSPPLPVNEDFLLRIAPLASTPVGSNPFYFVSHASTAFGNELEADEPNDNTPQMLTQQAAQGAVRYFGEGDLIPADSDTDVFSAAVPAAGLSLTVTCGGQRSGSGLRGLAFDLTNQDGDPLPNGSSPSETEMDDAIIEGFTVPAGVTAVQVHVTAASQDPNVTSTFYRCGITFVSP